MEKDTERRIIVVTGLSGAGKTIALRALEDSGFFCVDNFPFPLIRELLTLTFKNQQITDVAIGVDIRERGFLDDTYKHITELKSEFNLYVLFLEADTEVLLRRYKETRRPHPLQEGQRELIDAMRYERQMLQGLRELADMIIDTSSYTPHQLRELMLQRFCSKQYRGFFVTLLSFGYKYGIPPNVDLLFDIRFLPNPHFIEELRPLTGLDREVRGFVLGDTKTRELLEKLKDLLLFLLPEYKKEGKSSVTIGVGCTGGRHRSPAVVEALKTFIMSELGIPVQTVHREL